MTDNAFSRLHVKLQEAIYRENWQALRPLQTNAISAVLDGKADIILAASTASGKTEAAFLPILSSIADADPEGGVKALCLSPLKALINDQFRRMERLCELAGIPVHRWHGDVSAGDKARLRQSPGGVLLITPESLESQFLNHDQHLSKLYRALEFIVIDELHAFLDNVRGAHLRSLLARLEIAAAVAPRRVGLSATLGDFQAARLFLCPDAPQTVVIVEDPSQQKDQRLVLKACIDDPKDDETKETTPGGLDAVAADLAHRFRREANLVFCNSRRQTELLADKLCQIEAREHWPHNPFLLHHSSLSRELREEAEALLKSGRPVTALCTSTLEMGIDLGSVRAIGQVGPPWTVASLVQRLGRSGRGEGEAQILRLYTLDRPVTAKSSLSDRLHPELTRGIAMVELFREKWLEPAEGERRHFSTAVHQTLSILRQTGGVPAAVLHDRLCGRGAFRAIKKTPFAALLRGLAAHKLIEQMPSSELILAPAGEKIVESRDFYAAFATRLEYSVEHDGRAVGALPADAIPAQAECFLLAGRRWRVELINHPLQRVLVHPAKGWKQPRFTSETGAMHPRVAAQMKAVLAAEALYPYLDKPAAAMLAGARQSFRQSSLAVTDAIITPPGLKWFPWAGTRVLRTLELCARVDGISVERDGLCLSYARLMASDFGSHCRKIAAGKFTAEALLAKVTAFKRDRFDEYVAAELLKEAYASEVMDLTGAREAAARLMEAAFSA